MRPLLLLLLACGDAPGGDSGASDGADGADATDGADGTVDDADGDGWTAAEGDCDDADPEVHPEAPERCNGLDDDCDGAPHPEEGADGAACQACDAAGWWADVRDEAGRDDRVAAALQGDVCTDYDRARDGLFQLEADGGTVTCLYTGRTFSLSGGVDFDEVNAEHAWPRSDGADPEPAECDLHHLFVTDARANSRRANHPFGEVRSTDWSDGGSLLGDSASGETVFEPRDDAKGDIARAMLYFQLKYAAVLTPEAQAKHLDAPLFAAWHAADPPDAAEQERSLDFAEFQSGRANPFVVCPWLVPALVE